MNILIIGATGRTGKLVLEQGLRRGHAASKEMRTRMSKRTSAQWMVSGIVEAPVETVWKVLLDSNLDLSPDDKEAITREGGPDPFTMSIAKSEGGKVHVEVDKRHHRIATQGEWWYRGVSSVEPHEQGSLLI